MFEKNFLPDKVEGIAPPEIGAGEQPPWEPMQVAEAFQVLPISIGSLDTWILLFRAATWRHFF